MMIQPPGIHGHVPHGPGRRVHCRVHCRVHAGPDVCTNAVFTFNLVPPSNGGSYTRVFNGPGTFLFRDNRESTLISSLISLHLD